MSNSNFRVLFDFRVETDTLVDETSTREENGQPVTVTTKVTKKVPTYFAFKEPSRAEREDADVERAAWWNRFVEKGLMPQAELMKKYANVGGSMSDSQKDGYRRKQADLLILEQQLKRAEVNESENTELIDSLAVKLVDLRDDIIAFEREQSSFFENTAEAKAREKLIEYLVMHLSYFRTDPDKNWEPFFKGATTAEKLVNFDRMMDEQDPLLLKAKNQLEFLAAIRASNSGPIKRDDLEKFISEI